MTEPLADRANQLATQSTHNMKPNVDPQPTSLGGSLSANKDHSTEDHPADPKHSIGLTERLQRALNHIKLLETHNTKLYEDNCQLVTAVNMLNERQAFVGASVETQIQHLASLQERLRASETHRTIIVRRYQDLLANNSSASVYHHLASELQAARVANVQLDREYQLMKEKYSRLKYSLSMDNHPAQRPSSAPAQGHLAVVSQPSGNPHLVVHQRHEKRLSVDAPVHIVQHRQPQSGGNPISPSTSVVPEDRATALQQHKRWTSEGISQLHAHRNPSAITWLPTPPPSAHASGPTSLLPPHTAPSVLCGPARVHNQHPAPRPPILTGFHCISAPIGKTHSVPHGVPSTPAQVVGTHHDQSGVIDLTQDRPAEESKSQPPQSLKRPSTDLEDSEKGGVGENKKLRIEAPTEEPAQTPPDAYASDVAQSSAASPTQSFSDQRLITESPRPVSPNVLPSPPAIAGPHSPNQVAAQDEDGLRTYEECVKLIFEKDADVENGLFCGPCLDRYEAGMLQEPPDILVEPKFDYLVIHCMTVHPTIWSDLRRRRDVVQK